MSFPQADYEGQLHTIGNTEWRWDGEKWVIEGSGTTIKDVYTDEVGLVRDAQFVQDLYAKVLETLATPVLSDQEDVNIAFTEIIDNLKVGGATIIISERPPGTPDAYGNIDGEEPEKGNLWIHEETMSLYVYDGEQWVQIHDSCNGGGSGGSGGSGTPVYDGVLTIKDGEGKTLGEFSANQSFDNEIIIPTLCEGDVVNNNGNFPPGEGEIFYDASDRIVDVGIEWSGVFKVGDIIWIDEYKYLLDYVRIQGNDKKYVRLRTTEQVRQSSKDSPQNTISICDPYVRKSDFIDDQNRQDAQISTIEFKLDALVGIQFKGIYKFVHDVQCEKIFEDCVNNSTNDAEYRQCLQDFVDCENNRILPGTFEAIDPDDRFDYLQAIIIHNDSVDGQELEWDQILTQGDYLEIDHRGDDGLDKQNYGLYRLDQSPILKTNAAGDNVYDIRLTFLKGMGILAVNEEYEIRGIKAAEGVNPEEIGDFLTQDTADTLYASKNHKHSWSEITSKPSTFPPESHTHDYASSDHKHDTLYVKGNYTITKTNNVYYIE